MAKTTIFTSFKDLYQSAFTAGDYIEFGQARLALHLSWTNGWSYVTSKKTMDDVVAQCLSHFGMTLSDYISFRGSMGIPTSEANKGIDPWPQAPDGMCPHLKQLGLLGYARRFLYDRRTGPIIEGTYVVQKCCLGKPVMGNSPSPMRLMVVSQCIGDGQVTVKWVGDNGQPFAWTASREDLIYVPDEEVPDQVKLQYTELFKYTKKDPEKPAVVRSEWHSFWHLYTNQDKFKFDDDVYVKLATLGTSRYRFKQEQLLDLSNVHDGAFFKFAQTEKMLPQLLNTTIDPVNMGHKRYDPESPGQARKLALYMLALTESVITFRGSENVFKPGDWVCPSYMLSGKEMLSSGIYSYPFLVGIVEIVRSHTLVVNWLNQGPKDNTWLLQSHPLEGLMKLPTPPQYMEPFLKKHYAGLPNTPAVKLQTEVDPYAKGKPTVAPTSKIPESTYAEFMRNRSPGLQFAMEPRYPSFTGRYPPPYDDTPLSQSSQTNKTDNNVTEHERNIELPATLIERGSGSSSCKAVGIESPGCQIEVGRGYVENGRSIGASTSGSGDRAELG